MPSSLPLPIGTASARSPALPTVPATTPLRGDVPPSIVAMERGALHPSLAPARPPTDGDALCFPRLASTSSPFSPPTPASGSVDASLARQSSAFRPTLPPLTPTMATSLTAPPPAADAPLAVFSPLQVYEGRPNYSLYSAALHQARTLHHLPTSPVAPRNPEMAPPPPLAVGNSGDVRWTPSVEATVLGDHLMHNHLPPPRVPPQARVPSSEFPLRLSKRRRSDGDPGETPFHFIRSEVDECRASAVAETELVGRRACSVPPAVGAERASDSLPALHSEKDVRHGPAYVKQRREYWSTVLNGTYRLGAVRSAEKEEGWAPDTGTVSVLAPQPRDRTLAVPPPPPSENPTLAGTYGYHGGLDGPAGGGRSQVDRRYSLVHPEGAGGAEPLSRKRRAQLVDDADDICGNDPGAYNLTAGGNGGKQDGGSGGGSQSRSRSRSDSGSNGDGDDALRAHVCSQCLHRFKRAYDLTQHKAAVHAKLRPYSCKMCGRTFGHVGTRTKHYRTIHIGLKLHGCDFCEQRFSEKGNMRRHVERSHPTAEVKL